MKLKALEDTRHALRQPGGPDLRIRGFASPDYSGFAFSEMLILYFNPVVGVTLLLLTTTQFMHLSEVRHYNKKRSHRCRSERFPSQFMKGLKNILHLLRQPGGPDFGIRGFASPDYSGFALSVDCDLVCWWPLYLKNKNKSTKLMESYSLVIPRPSPLPDPAW